MENVIKAVSAGAGALVAGGALDIIGQASQQIPATAPWWVHLLITLVPPVLAALATYHAPANRLKDTAGAAPAAQPAIRPDEPPAIVPAPTPRPTTIAAPLVAFLALGALAFGLSACANQPAPGTAVTNPTTGAIEHVATQKQLAAATACRTFFGTADPSTGVVIERGAASDAADLMRAGKLKGAGATTVMLTALGLQVTCSNPSLLNALSDAQADADTAKLNAAAALIAAAKTGD